MRARTAALAIVLTLPLLGFRLGCTKDPALDKCYAVAYDQGGRSVAGFRWLSDQEVEDFREIGWFVAGPVDPAECP